jgi:hypothetical protein
MRKNRDGSKDVKRERRKEGRKVEAEGRIGCREKTEDRI